jgi:pilus assembly protein Flp/PilA
VALQQDVLATHLLYTQSSGLCLSLPQRWKETKIEEITMKNMILKSISRLHQDEAGQGLVEYALILALVAFAAVVAMQTLALDINNAFKGIGSILSSYVP